MRRLASIACALAVVSGCGAAETEDARLVERSHVSMGTEVRLTAWTADEADAVAAFERAFAEFDRLDTLMTVWREESDVARLNASAGVAPVPVSPEVREVLRLATQVSAWTAGKFDVTFAALSDVWRFDEDIDGRIPDASAIAERLPRVDYTAVRIDDAAGTAFVAAKGARINLGGIGKGYAVDRAGDIMRSSGLGDFMIQAGGDLFVGGSRGERAWRVGIRDPRGPADAIFAALDLRDATFSTSGDYERAFVRDGRRYHHILDPDTGRPAARCRSVTIVARSAALADALSTGVFVLGAEDGMALIERLPDVEGVIVTASNDVAISSGLKGRLELLAPPTDAP